MDHLRVFTNSEFGDVRTVMVGSEPYFVGKDVAEVLGYSNSRKALADHIDSEDKVVTKCYTLGGTQELTVINESGLYSLIISSKLPSAKRFKRWITAEVLPSIRKNGGYINQQEELTPEALIAKALVVANSIIEEKNKQIQEMKPKAGYFDSLVDSRLLTTLRDTAKEFHMPPKEFNDWLRENGYIYNDKHNMIKPYEIHRKAGLFQMKDFTTPQGYSGVHTFITVKGKETFRLLLGK